MDFIKFDAEKCSLCGVCVEKCPFGALSMGEKGITVGDTCRMCGLCVRQCPEKAIKFEQKANAVDKSQWKDFLVFVEQIFYTFKGVFELFLRHLNFPPGSRWSHAA